MNDKYSDLLLLPHPNSSVHRRMPLANRAAQFAPFAALTGYEDAVHETARWTDTQLFLSEDQITCINHQLEKLMHYPNSAAEIIYFKHDLRKSGGQYSKIVGRVKKIDDINHQLILIDGSHIPLQDVFSIHVLQKDR